MMPGLIVAGVTPYAHDPDHGYQQLNDSLDKRDSLCEDVSIHLDVPYDLRHISLPQVGATMIH